MANNPYVNQVQKADGTIIMDISDTTAEAGDVIQGKVFYTKSGARVTGALGTATQTSDGLMSAADKTTLDGLAAENTRVWYGTCTTAAATQAKAVTIEGLTKLVVGDVFIITFTNNQNYNGAPTMQINSLNAKNIRRLTGSNAGRYEWNSGETVIFVWNGTYFLIVNGGFASTTYYGRTKLANSATSTSTAVALVPASLNSLAQSMISGAPVYSTSATYAVGDRVRYGSQTWECVTAITTPEAWTAAHWRALDPVQVQIDNIFTMTLAELRQM